MSSRGRKFYRAFIDSPVYRLFPDLFSFVNVFITHLTGDVFTPLGNTGSFTYTTNRAGKAVCLQYWRICLSPRHKDKAGVWETKSQAAI